MSYNGNEGEVISLQTAAEWTANYRNSPNFDGVNAILYGHKKIRQILDQENCIGIRIYKAIDDQDQAVLVLIGTDADGNELTNGIIVERGLVCPPYCGSGNGLHNM
jgi:hypothetical protein